jgi:hypothetical protein
MVSPDSVYLDRPPALACHEPILAPNTRTTSAVTRSVQSPGYVAVLCDLSSSPSRAYVKQSAVKIFSAFRLNFRSPFI